MTLLDNIKYIANRRGLSIKNIADKIGTTEKTIYNWDKTSPKASNLLKVANVLGVSTDYLLSNEIGNNLSNTQLTLAMSIDPDVSDEELQQAIDYIKFMHKQRVNKDDTNRKN